MGEVISTVEQSDGFRANKEGDQGPAQPGLLLVFSGTELCWSIIPLGDSELELGRDQLATYVQDARISRRHTRVCFRDQRVWAMDLGSLNGSSIDGRAAIPKLYQPVERCLRIGDTILLTVADIRLLGADGPTEQGGRVIGPRLAAAYRAIARFAKSASTLYVGGESGVGKEEAAHIFHRAGPKASGPFVAVNCAAIPESIAERLLFGAQRGAFSGVNTDSDGYIQAADGGTIFLDEIAELHSAVQAKLLRVLENREVLMLGAVKPRRIDLRVCSASQTSLRDQVSQGRLRADLYYRIGRPEVTIPPLRERLEEIPYLIHGELRKHGYDQRLHFSFVEACLLRSWPGNIRELLTEVRTAMQEAIADNSPRIEARHLNATAGLRIDSQSASQPAGPPPAAQQPLSTPKSLDQTAAGNPFNGETPPGDGPSMQIIEDVLQRTGGNISKAARKLGMHRNSLRRLIARHGINIDSADETIPSGGSSRS